MLYLLALKSALLWLKASYRSSRTPGEIELRREPEIERWYMVTPRPAQTTVKFIDEYCEVYRDLFPEVRTFEYFKYLHLGLISELKRKTLPAIAKVVGLEDAEGLDHFLTKSPWSVEVLKTRRLELILRILNEEEIVVIIDETGDKKKGNTTDYVKRQYIGNLGKIENGIVAVTAYGLIRGMTFPLIEKVYKPKERLKEGDIVISNNCETSEK